MLSTIKKTFHFTEQLPCAEKTRSALLWTSVFSEPLLTIYCLFGFILRKDLQASAFQISILTMLKPVVAILSLYWSYSVYQRRGNLIKNLLWAGFLSRAPFLLFPFVENIWVLIVCAGIYMLFFRAGNPAWMEILKLNLPEKKRNVLFSLGSAIGYLEGVFLAIGIGALLDYDSQLWRLLFPLAALLGMLSLFFQSKIPLQEDVESSQQIFSVRNVFQPWKSAWRLLQDRRDFLRFQIGFMICGFGLMLIQPALPILFSDVLDLSYTEMLTALSIFRGVSYAMTSNAWARLMNRIDIYCFSSILFFLVSLYAALLLCSPLSVGFIYFAYSVYGMASSGNHLSWNLSGPIFSKDEDSSLFSSVNVLTLGLRGCVAPPFGAALCFYLGPMNVIGLGMLLCMFSGFLMYMWSDQKKISLKACSPFKAE